MPKTDYSAITEHKCFNLTCPFPAQGVHFNWCHQNVGFLHDHDYYEFVVIIEGKVEHLVNEHKTIASKGMFFLIKPNEFHQFTPHHQSHVTYINFWLSVPALKELSNAVWEKDISNIINEFVFTNDLFLPQKIFETILNLIDNLTQFPINSQNRYAYIKCIIVQLLLFLLQKVDMQEMLVQSPDYPAWLDTFLTKLHDINVFTLKLQDIYPLAPYSRPMLNIYFKKYVGSTLITYVTNLKINHACNLLQYTDLSPLQISNLLNYDSLSHFNRIFKKYSGLSPIAYRKNFLGKNTV